MNASAKLVLELPTAVGERHYTVGEMADNLKLSRDKVRRLFEKEPGVLVIQRENNGRRRRCYRTLRIPQSVAERVYRRLLNR